MDQEDEPLVVAYKSVSPLEIGLDEDEEGVATKLSTNPTIAKTGHHDTNDSSKGFLFHTLLPDESLSFRNHPILEGVFTVKLLKFICFTFVSIALMHLLVANVDGLGDRDGNLELWHIWTFEGNLIVFDAVVFFLVGRLWKQRGVDHLAFLLPVILCNVYFSCQHFFTWLRHSVTLYEMHCVWPWQLWAFVGILVPSIGAIVLCHVWRAYQRRLLVLKLMELGICAFFFLIPMAGSSYFHLHHWFAGWLVGMHCNFDVWWSQAAMAWCWGMYINGIAVYGRDPVLSCEYAYFLSMDNRCPYMACYVEAMQHKNETNHSHVEEMVPVDWRNCSAQGFHP